MTIASDSQRIAVSSPARIIHPTQAEALEPSLTRSAMGLLPFGVLLVMLPLTLFGCKSTPEVDPPPVRSQPIDAHSADLLIEDAAQYIVTELPNAPGVQGTQYRLALGMGPIEATNFAQPERFDTVMRSLNTRLMRNATMTRLFRMVSVSVPTAESITRALSGAHADDMNLPDSDAYSGPAKFDPRDIYILTGTFTQFGDAGGYERSLRLSINVEHPQSRQIVISKAFNRNFVWDTASGTWRAIP